MSAHKKKEPQDRGPVINIKGGIHPGRDAILGNQYNYGGQSQQIANVQTPAEFMAELKKLQLEIAALKQHPQLTPDQLCKIEVVETRVGEAVMETQKPKPLGERIKATLIAAKDSMDTLAASLGSAAALGTTIGGLGLLAIKVFGG